MATSDPDPTGEPRLDADTLHVASTRLSHVRLMDDARWPWLLLVPRIASSVTRSAPTELHHLSGHDRAALMEETALVGDALQRATGCTSINVGALGNVVARLHVHVVARDPVDPAWPGPVWGVGKPVPLERDGAGAVREPEFVDAVRRVLPRRR